MALMMIVMAQTVATVLNSVLGHVTCAPGLAASVLIAMARCSREMGGEIVM